MDRQRHVPRIAVAGVSIGCVVALGACGTGSTDPSGSLDASGPVPCVISPAVLLAQSQLPPDMRSESPATTSLGVVGGYGRLSGIPAYPGSIGDTTEYFQWTGVSQAQLSQVPDGATIYDTDPTQVFQLAEQITDLGTLSNAKRSMAGLHAANVTNTIPRYGSGVERIPPVPAMGDDAFMYQIDDGAAYGFAPYTGPFVGHIYTNIEVRVGVVILALSIDAGPEANPGALAVSTMQNMLANEDAVCPWIVPAQSASAAALPSSQTVLKSQR
jgi:hypothetical protein